MPFPEPRATEQGTVGVIGASAEAGAIAALCRRQGIVTQTVWSGKLKKQLASLSHHEVVVIADRTPIVVKDMLTGGQREATTTDEAVALVGYSLSEGFYE